MQSTDDFNIRGFRVNEDGKLYPDLYEQKINLYVSSLQYRYRSHRKTLSILNATDVPNPRGIIGAWTKCGIRTCIRSGERIGHLPFNPKKAPRNYLKDILDHGNVTSDQNYEKFGQQTEGLWHAGRLMRHRYNTAY